MDRVVETFRIGPHDVSIVESLNDEGSWFFVVVDEQERDEMLAAPPKREELERMLDLHHEP